MNLSSLPPTPADEPDLVKKDELKKYLCTLHNGILRNAVQTLCGHRYCESCIVSLLSTNGDVLCPAKEEDCVVLSSRTGSGSQINPDFSTRREILNLKVYCPFKKFGCKWTKAWKHSQRHAENCEFNRRSCPNECGKFLRPASVPGHLAEECERRTVTCPNCSAPVQYRHQQNHLDGECPETEMSCPNRCGSAPFKRRKLSEHVETCPNKPKKCRFSTSGCTFEARRDGELEDHLRSSTVLHLSLLADQLAGLVVRPDLGTAGQESIHERPEDREINKEAERLRKDNKQLQVRVVTLTERTITLDNRLEELTRKAEADAERFSSQVETLQATMLAYDQPRPDIPGAERLGRTLYAFSGQHVTAMSGATKDPSKRLQRVEQQVDIHDIRLAEADLRFQIIETTNYQGILMWKIKDYHKRKQEAIERKTLSLFSQPFYTHQSGYKMCARVYLNGDGIGKNTHLSLFFVVMRGEYDNLLPWPFRNKVTMMLLDQETGRSPLVDAFRPDPGSSSFQKPTSEMNVASGCPVFIPHIQLETDRFLREDTIYIKVVVDTHA